MLLMLSRQVLLLIPAALILPLSSASTESGPPCQRPISGLRC